MADVTNEILLEQLLKNSSEIGTLTAKVDGFNTALRGHIVDDQRMLVSIDEIKDVQAQQRGAVRMLAGLGSVVTFGTSIAAYFIGKHHT